MPAVGPGGPPGDQPRTREHTSRVGGADRHRLARDRTRTGRYRAVLADAASRISYLDFAVALLDEVDTPEHHHTHVGIEAD